MLSEEKKQTKLINANVITRHNAIVISCDEQMQISSFSLFKHFPIKCFLHLIDILNELKVTLIIFG